MLVFHGACQAAIASSSRPRSAASSTSRRHEGLADAARQDEGELAALGLLVAAHVVDQPGGVPVHAGCRRRSRAAASAGRPRRDGGARAPASAVGQSPRRADRSKAIAMPTPTASPWSRSGAEAGLGLERVAEGMAEIEQRAQVGGLALVGRDDARLGGAALLDGIGALGGVAGQHGGAVALAPCRRRPDRRSARTSPPRHSPPAARAGAGCRARRYRPAPAAADGRRRPGSCRGAC